MAVDYLGASAVIANEDKRSEEVWFVGIAVDGAIEIIEELERLLSAPRVRTLVIGDRELEIAREHLSQRILPGV